MISCHDFDLRYIFTCWDKNHVAFALVMTLTLLSKTIHALSPLLIVGTIILITQYTCPVHDPSFIFTCQDKSLILITRWFRIRTADTHQSFSWTADHPVIDIQMADREQKLACTGNLQVKCLEHLGVKHNVLSVIGCVAMGGKYSFNEICWYWGEIRHYNSFLITLHIYRQLLAST